jgi:hypothetical protein
MNYRTSKSDWYPRTITTFFFAILIVGSVGLYYVRPVPGDIALAGLAIIWVSLIPGFAILQGVDKNPAPLVAILGIFYAIFFGLPVFTIKLAWPDAHSIILYQRVNVGEINIDTLLIVLAGVTALFFSFYISRNIFLNQIPTFRFGKKLNPKNVRILLWSLLVGHIMYRYYPPLSALPSLGQFLEPVGYIGLGGLALSAFRKNMLRPELIIFGLIFLPLEIYSRVRNLFITEIIQLFLFASFVLWHTGRTKLFGCSIALIIFVVLSYGTSQAVRGRYDTNIEKLAVVKDIFVKQMILGTDRITYEDGKIFGFYGRFGSLVKRTSHIWIFHSVDEKSPDLVPYWAGESYRPLFTSFIPRVIYPNKTTEIAGGTFGRRYGFLYPENFTTSLNLPWITELLANFGRSGVVWGMALFGLFIGFLDRVFNAKGMRDLEYIVGLSLIFPLFYPESNFSLMVGSLLPLFVGVVVYFTLGSFLLDKVIMSRK